MTRATRRPCSLPFAALIALLAGPALALTEVEFQISGVDEATEATLRDAMELSSPTRLAIEDEVTETQDQLGAILSEYRTQLSVLYGKGFYGPEISVKIDGREAADIDPFNVPRSFDKVVVSVDPGPLFRFGKTEVGPREPGAAATGEPLVSGFAPGEPAGSALVGAAANAAIGEWRDVGHVRAGIGSQEIFARHRDAMLDVDIFIDKDVPLRFGKVVYRGQSNVREKRIREMLGLPTGELVTPTELNRAANRLRRTGTFKTVVLSEAETVNSDGTLDYDLTVIDQLPRRFGFGAEYSTLEGLLVNGYWLHRNLFGGAERLRFDAEIANLGAGTDAVPDVGGVDYSLTARLSRPATFGPDNDGYIQAGLEREDEPDYLEDTASVIVGLNRYFSDTLYGELGGGYRYSYVEDAFGDREFNHVILPGRLEWDRRGIPGDPLNGFYFSVVAVPGWGVNGSSDLVFLNTDTRGYISLGESLTFAARVQAGSTLMASIEDVPPDFLFFSGGGDTVRGQSYKSLGGAEKDGYLVGGRSFVGTSTELRARFGELGVVAFADVGYIDTGARITEDSNHHSGIGLGVRYATPIGPIRVDIATPYDGQNEDERFKRVELYIGVGQAF